MKAAEFASCVGVSDHGSFRTYIVPRIRSATQNGKPGIKFSSALHYCDAAVMRLYRSRIAPSRFC